MGFTISQGKDAVRAAHKFQVNAELKDVRLLECSASGLEDTAQLPEKLRLGFKMDPTVLGVSEGEARFSVRISVFGNAKEAPEDAGSHLFHVACRYVLTYELRPGYAPSKEELEAFKDGNAIFHCWPYNRELIQNFTMRMSLPIPPLPFLRLAPKSEPKKSPGRRQPGPEEG